MTRSAVFAALSGQRILIVEAEYFIADDLCCDLKDRGVLVVGPVGTLHDAQAAAQGGDLACAVVDYKLRGETSQSLLEALCRMNVPILLVTGYDMMDLPVSFQTLPMVQKPASREAVAEACAKLCT
jgi:ActR/RegA family two-component response regulator